MHSGSTSASLRAGWQQGLVERHGGSLGELSNRCVCKCHIKGRQQAQGALAMHAGQERNSDKVPRHPRTDCV